MNPEPPSSRYTHRKHHGATCPACAAAEPSIATDRFALTDAGYQLLEELQAEAELGGGEDDVGDDDSTMSRN